MESYTAILHKFNFKNEQELTANYSSYLAFLSKKIDDLLKNENLKKLEKILDKTDYIVNLSVFKVAVIVAVITTGINFIILK